MKGRPPGREGTLGPVGSMSLLWGLWAARPGQGSQARTPLLPKPRCRAPSAEWQGAKNGYLAIRTRPWPQVTLGLGSAAGREAGLRAQALRVEHPPSGACRAQVLGGSTHAPGPHGLGCPLQPVQEALPVNVGRAGLRDSLVPKARRAQEPSLSLNSRPELPHGRVGLGKPTVPAGSARVCPLQGPGSLTQAPQTPSGTRLGPNSLSCVFPATKPLSSTDQPMARGGGGVTAWLQAVVQEQGRHLPTWAPGLARASCPDTGWPDVSSRASCSREAQEPMLRLARGLRGRAGPCLAGFCGPLPGARAGWGGPPLALLLPSARGPPLSPPLLSSPWAGVTSDSGSAVSPGWPGGAQCAWGSPARLVGHRAQAGAPPPARDACSYITPQLVFLGWHSSFPPSQQVLISIFQAQVAKDFLMRSPRSPLAGRPPQPWGRPARGREGLRARVSCQGLREQLGRGRGKGKQPRGPPRTPAAPTEGPSVLPVPGAPSRPAQRWGSGCPLGG